MSPTPPFLVFSPLVPHQMRNKRSGEQLPTLLPPVAERDAAEHITSPARTGRKNPCLLFITASVAWLNLGPGDNTTGRPTFEGNAF